MTIRVEKDVRLMAEVQLEPLSQHVGQFVSRAKTIEAVPRAKCRVCGLVVYFDTDGDGYLIAEDKDGRRHPCEGAEEGEGE